MQSGSTPLKPITATAMNSLTRHSKKSFLASLAVLALAPLGRADSLEQAVAHGVSPADFAEARTLWDKARTVLPVRTSGVKLAEAHRGFRDADFALAADSEVIVTFLYDGGAKRSSLGWYDAANPSEKRLVWRDASTGPDAPLAQGSKTSLGVLPMGTKLRFFVRHNGARGGNTDLHQDAALNLDKRNHIAARFFAAGTGPLFIAFEDKPGGGDDDFNDLIFRVEIVPVAGPKLHRVNTTTGKTNLVGTLAVAGNYDNLALDPLTGELLMMANNGSRIHHLNPFTGKIVATERTDIRRRNLVRTVVCEKLDATFATDSSGNILRVDLSTKDIPTKTIATLPAGWIPGDIVYDEAGDRLIVYAERKESVRLFAISAPASASPGVKELCGLPRKASGLAWAASGRLLAFNPTNGVVYGVDPATGAVASLGESGLGAITGDLTSAGYNPAVKVDASPVQLWANGADMVTQYDNVVPGQKGIKSSRGLPGTLLANKLASASHESAHELFYIPANATRLDFKLLDDRGGYSFHFALFDYAAVDGLDPASLAYRVAAAKAAIPVFDDRLHNPGAAASIDVARHNLAGKVVGFFIVPNNLISKFLSNPETYTVKGFGNDTKRRPLFTVSAANPGKLDQAFAFADAEKTLFTFEDLTRDTSSGEAGGNSDNSFDDMTFSVTPALKPVGNPVEVFLLEPAAPEIRNRQTTADVNVDWAAALADLGKIEKIDTDAHALLADAYVHVTNLRSPVDNRAKLFFADPDRPAELLTVFPRVGAKAAIKATCGIGLRASGAKLRFRLENGATKLSSSAAEQSKEVGALTLGRVPGTDILLAWTGDDPATAEYLFGVSFEAWDLRHSGDVRNLLKGGDGVTAKPGKAVY